MAAFLSPLFLLVTARDNRWQSFDLFAQERFVQDALESKTGEAAAGWIEWQHSYAAFWNATVRCSYTYIHAPVHAHSGDPYGVVLWPAAQVVAAALLALLMRAPLQKLSFRSRTINAL